MKKKFVVVVMGYWGKGDTLQDDAKNAVKAGARKNELAVAYCYVGPESVDLESIAVDCCGDINYPQGTESIYLFGPRVAKVKLGQLFK